MTLHIADSHWRVNDRNRRFDVGVLTEEIRNSLRASAERPLEIESARDEGLRSDQRIDPTIPVTILIRGAAGRLADGGLLALGARELAELLGEQNPVRYILCDVFPTDSERARAFVENQKAAGNYALHESCPYICAHDLNTSRSRELGIDAIIAATPPNVHSQDALLAWELGAHAFIEKPAYTPATPGQAKGIIMSSLESGKIDLIDCFLANRAICEFLDNSSFFLSGEFTRSSEGLGAIRFIHATCFEPHSANEEGSRAERLMDYDMQGGFLYADMAPHPLAVTEAILQKVLGLSLSQSRILGTYRAREESVRGPADAETAAAVLRAIDAPGESPLASKSGIELLSVAGKGLLIPGGRSGAPMSNYMVTIGCEKGRVDICLGNAQKTIPSYICVTPNDPASESRMRVYKNSGLGYCSLLADYAIHTQERVRSARGAVDSSSRGALERVALMSHASLHAACAIEETYNAIWRRDERGLQRYGSNQMLDQATLPRQLPLACRIHPQLEEDKSRGVSYEVLRRAD